MDDQFDAVLIAALQHPTEGIGHMLVLSVDGSEVRAASGHLIQPDGAFGSATVADLIVIPAIEGIRLLDHFEPDSRLVAWLRSKRKGGSKFLAMTTGVCFLAAAGLAEERGMATHWAFLGALKKPYPSCQFAANRPHVQSGDVWTIGTWDGWFNAFFEMLALDRGDNFSQLCAAHLLVSDPSRLNPILPSYRNHNDEAVLKVQDWIESHHSEAITIEHMGRQIGLAERTLKRRFRQATGLPPNIYV